MENKYCSKLNINCKYVDICNNLNLHKINKSYRKVFFSDNIEGLLLDVGIKKIRKIEMLDIISLKKYIEFYKTKYFYGSYTFNDSNNIIGQEDENKLFILILSKKSEYINKYIYFDHSPKSIDRVIATGILLGYPECCSKLHYKSIKDLETSRKVDDDFDKNIYSNGIKCKLLNPYLRLYVHIPCSNDCKKTIQNSQKVLEYLESIYGQEIVYYFFNYVNKGNKK